jgi:hypothetical protein
LKDKLAWDGTTLSIVGQIQVSNGSFVPGSSLYQHGPLTYWPRINGMPPDDQTVLPNASWIGQSDSAIEYVMGPYGTQELAITCYPDSGFHSGDGGFISNPVPIDSGSAYMFVVYMKRTKNSEDGDAYFGLDGYNENIQIGVMTNADTPVVNTNPYFMFGDITPAGETAADSKDRWFLHVGYVYPSGSVYNPSANNIVYDLTTGLTASYEVLQTTYTWQTGTTHTLIRAFHMDNAAGDDVSRFQEIARPGIFKMDGTEPTIQSLLSNTSTGGSTKIDGSTITTGQLRSNNWSETLGSELDLNTGTITLGGSGSPKFNVNASGDVTASNALFSGNVSAVNFSKKMITVTNDNSSLYFQTVSGGINLIFDGSFGGEKTMVMEIACPTNPSLNIKNIIVSNTGTGLMPQVEVIISQNNVTFDNGTIKIGTALATREL